MKSKLELCSMIYEMYMAAFLAGSRCDDEHIAQARDKRDELLYAVKFMCNELDDLSRDYEQLEEDMRRECDTLRNSRSFYQEGNIDLYSKIDELNAKIQCQDDDLKKIRKERDELINRTNAQAARIRMIIKDSNAMYAQLEKIQGPDIRDMYPSFDDIADDVDPRVEWLKKNTTVFDNIPDDGDKFSEHDLPFPDVDDLAPASELLGGDE